MKIAGIDENFLENDNFNCLQCCVNLLTGKSGGKKRYKIRRQIDLAQSRTVSSHRGSRYDSHKSILEVIMSIDRLVLAFAGSFILISLALSHYHSVYWLWFTAFIGANLLQSAFTGFCPLAIILKALGIKPGNAFS